MGLFYSQMALLAVRQGNQIEAKAFQERSLEIFETALGLDHPLVFHQQACYHALNRDRAAALDYVRKTIEKGRYDGLNDPDLSFLHGDPEFEAIVAEVKQLVGEQ